MSSYEIVQKQETETKTFDVNNIKIFVDFLTLNVSVRLRVELYMDSELKTIKYVTLTGSEYADWGTNDNYLVDRVAHHLGLTIIQDLNL